MFVVEMYRTGLEKASYTEKESGVRTTRSL